MAATAGSMDGPSIVKTRGDKAAFASVIDREVQGLTRDKMQDQNRQLFGDGSGFRSLR